MNKDKILELAYQAGFLGPDLGGLEGNLWEPTGGENVTDVVFRFAALVAASEREACAELVWPTQQIKHWSEEELTSMTGAFNRAQEKHGWYETIMAVGAAALKHRAAAIRAR